jgi:hypothetical protein
MGAGRVVAHQFGHGYEVVSAFAQAMDDASDGVGGLVAVTAAVLRQRDCAGVRARERCGHDRLAPGRA